MLSHQSLYRVAAHVTRPSGNSRSDQWHQPLHRSLYVKIITKIDFRYIGHIKLNYVNITTGRIRANDAGLFKFIYPSPLALIRPVQTFIQKNRINIVKNTLGNIV